MGLRIENFQLTKPARLFLHDLPPSKSLITFIVLVNGERYTAYYFYRGGYGGRHQYRTIPCLFFSLPLKSGNNFLISDQCLSNHHM